jgi:hypothetical protein
MPKGPEVEATRRYIDRACVGRTIEDVIIVEAGGGPRKVLVDRTVLDVAQDWIPIRDITVNPSAPVKKSELGHARCHGWLCGGAGKK